MDVKPPTGDSQVNNEESVAKLTRCRSEGYYWKGVANNRMACGCAAMSGEGDSKLSLYRTSLRRIPPTIAVDVMMPGQADEVGE